MAKTVGLTFPEDDICLDKMTVTQLKRFAKDNDIDIGSAAKKDKIISAIIAAGNDMDEEGEAEV